MAEAHDRERADVGGAAGAASSERGRARSASDVVKGRSSAKCVQSRERSVGGDAN